MKTKTPVSTKKHSVTLKDLKTRKNPKGGAPCSPSPLDKTGKGGAINPIPGVDIIVRREPGGIAIQVKTGADGTYKFTRLAPGTYDLSTAGQPPQLVIVGSDGTLGGKLMKGTDGVVKLSCATGNHIKAK